VIVRILAEGQYEIGGEAERRLRAVDEDLLRHLEAGDEEAFQADFHAALELVRREGRRLPPEDLRPSDLILPARDFTLAEARTFFARGEG
jgi:hypothetical protein